MGTEAGRSRSPLGRVAVAGVLVLAGLLFAASAGTAAGTDLRTEGPDLRGLIEDESARLEQQAAAVADLRTEVERLTSQVGDVDVATLESKVSQLAPAAHLAPVSGSGLTVTLDDADLDRPVPAGASPDDLVVHQQDLQAVINALWQGGAEAVSVMDQRIIATSAVRCVGSTLRLQGRVYSPPYVIRAVGDVEEMDRSLDADPTVRLYRDFVRVFGLGYTVAEAPTMRLDAFDGSVELAHARVAGVGR